MRYHAVLFDLDGTLVDSVRLIFGTFNHVAERFLGRRYAPEEITSFFGPSEQSTWEQLLRPENLKEGLKAYLTYYQENHHQVILYDGIQRLLDRLQPLPVRTAIITGRGRRRVLGNFRSGKPSERSPRRLQFSHPRAARAVSVRWVV